MGITWQDAEVLAAMHMRELGFDDARTTGPGVDAGLDVIASGAVAQVKHLTAPVGAPDIQRFRGASYSHRRALFYSSSGYTAAAISAADRSEIALFLIKPGLSIEPVNDHACEVRPAQAPSTERAQIRDGLLTRVRSQHVRARAWQVVTRRRQDGSDREGQGEDPQPELLEVASMCDDPATFAETIRSRVLPLALAIIDLESQIRKDAFADDMDSTFEVYPELRLREHWSEPLERADLTQVGAKLIQVTTDLGVLESWALEHTTNRPALLALARGAAQEFSDFWAEHWGPIPATVVCPEE